MIIEKVWQCALMFLVTDGTSRKRIYAVYLILMQPTRETCFLDACKISFFSGMTIVRQSECVFLECSAKRRFGLLKKIQNFF